MDRKLILAFVVLLGLASAAFQRGMQVMTTAVTVAGGGALAVDSQMPAADGFYGNIVASPQSFAFNNAAGNVLYLAFELDGSASGSTIAATYNGVAMTSLGTISANSNSTTLSALYLFRLSSPATGSHNISMSWTAGGSRVVTAAAISFSGANATPDSGTATSAQDGGSFTTAFPVTVTSTTNGNYVIQAACWGDPRYSSVSGTLSANTDANPNGISYCNNLALQYATTSGGSKVMTTNGDTTTSFATLGIEVKH